MNPAARAVMDRLLAATALTCGAAVLTRYGAAVRKVRAEDRAARAFDARPQLHVLAGGA